MGENHPLTILQKKKKEEEVTIFLQGTKGKGAYVEKWTLGTMGEVVV